MKTWIKTTATIAALSMMVCAFSACGNDKAKDDDKKTDTTTAATTVTTTAEQTEPTKNDEQTPAVSDVSLEGTWVGTFDYAEQMNMVFGEDTFEPMVSGVILTFAEDGTYTLDVDDTALRASWVSQTDALIDAIIDMSGLEITKEEYFEEMGMTEDEFIESSVGEMDTNGTYEDNGDNAMLDEMYEAAYTIDGNTLTIDMMGIELTLTKK